MTASGRDCLIILFSLGSSCSSISVALQRRMSKGKEDDNETLRGFQELEILFHLHRLAKCLL